MNVRELRDFLAQLPDDMPVILQRDPEGNGYAPAAGADSDCIYVYEGNFYGDASVYSTDWSAYDADMGLQEWEEFKNNNPRVVVLFPEF